MFDERVTDTLIMATIIVIIISGNGLIGEIFPGSVLQIRTPGCTTLVYGAPTFTSV
jgi:hypothetical protein